MSSLLGSSAPLAEPRLTLGDRYANSRYHSLISGRAGLIVALLVLSVLTVLALAAPLIAPHNPVAVDSSIRLKAPTGTYYFGTDDQGRDIFARLLYGLRASLLVGLATAIASSVIGIVLGLASAYSRRVASVLMRFTDGLMAFPHIVFAIALIAVLGRGPDKIILALVVIFSPLFARVAYGEGRSIMQRDFIEGARLIGCGPFRLMSRHVLPNLVPILIVQFSYVFTHAIIAEASLSFVGAGIQPPSPSLGSVVQSGVLYMQSAWWMIWPAVGLLTILILALSLLGDALQDIFQQDR